MSDGIRSAFSSAIDDDGGAALAKPARRDFDEVLDHHKAFFAEGQGFIVHFRSARPDLYTDRPLTAIAREFYRANGLVRDLFDLAAHTVDWTAGDSARWQRDSIYELAQSLRTSVRAVRALDTWAGRKEDRYTDILGLPPVVKQDGLYYLNCRWCSTQFTSKRRHALYHSNTCNQRARRAAVNGRDDWLFNGCWLQEKIRADETLLPAIRSIAFYSRHPRCGVLNRGADVLEKIDADLASLAAELYKEV